MSSKAQVDLDFVGPGSAENDFAEGGASALPKAANPHADYLTDEEILGIEPPGSAAPRHSAASLSARTEDLRRGEARNPSSIAREGDSAGTRRDSSDHSGPQNDSQDIFSERGASPQTPHETSSQTVRDASPQNERDASPQTARDATAQMPGWMANAAADPAHGAEAQALWREHQEFRAAFSSPGEARAAADEARAIKELLPGGVQDARSLREATQSVEKIDAALFSGDARAQSEVVAELARANPAAFRSMFAEAARVLAGMGGAGQDGRIYNGQAADGLNAAPTLRETREGWGTQTDAERIAGNETRSAVPDSQITNHNSRFANRESRATSHESPVTSHESPATNHDPQFTDHGPRTTDHGPQTTSHGSQTFDPAAYASFERATNDAVARDVRGSIGETLSRVLPEGVAEGAARRIGEDIFQDVHRALAADRALSEQVAAVLRERRFGGAEQERVAALLAGRAKQLVPSVARRVIGEWTSTVLSTARNKAARQAAAASRVDIAAPGGSQDSMPLRAMSAKEVNYASLSDEEILGM